MSFNPLATDSRILKLLEHIWVVILDVWDATTKALQRQFIYDGCWMP